MHQVSLHSLSFHQTLQDHLHLGLGQINTEALLVQVQVHIHIYVLVPVYALRARQAIRQTPRHPTSHAISHSPHSAIFNSSASIARGKIRKQVRR